ncbi:MAG: hypothetical protein ACYS26_09850 [Planctomycetota bacterium]
MNPAPKGRSNQAMAMKNSECVVVGGIAVLALAAFTKAKEWQPDESYGMVHLTGTILEPGGGAGLEGELFFSLNWIDGSGRPRAAQVAGVSDASGEYSAELVDEIALLPTGRVGVTISTEQWDKGRSQVFSSQQSGQAAFDSFVIDEPYVGTEPKVELELEDLQLAFPPSIGTVQLSVDASDSISFVSFPNTIEMTEEDLDLLSPASWIELESGSGDGSNAVDLYSWAMVSRFRVYYCCPSWGATVRHRADVLRGSTHTLDMSACAVISVSAAPAALTTQSSTCIFDASGFDPAIPTTQNGYDALVRFEDRMEAALGRSHIRSFEPEVEFPVYDLGVLHIELWDGPSINRRSGYQQFTPSSPGRHQVTF